MGGRHLTSRTLQGRVALVTGAATGIGAAAPRALASAGATVAIEHGDAMKDFQDLTDPWMHKAAWRALDLTRAYAPRDRAAIIEHLEPDQLEYTRGILSVTRDRAADSI
ncbi:hypothetical protein [Streptomyces platensis]|uniref:hypothetical protein n=1 Tax=Streptomyces platensis TaxID=58346 RepID=UPI00386AB898|nr:hypothetical protein OG962_01290 [Streptomyces platensis]